MPIRNDSDLERAMQEFQRLRDAAPESPDAQRRDELDAEIKMYFMQHGDDLAKGKPRKDLT